MKQIKTRTGFECEIDPIVMDDMELFDLVVRIDRNDVVAYSLFLDKILGEKKASLYDHVREADGRVPIMKLSDEISDILEQLGGKK